MSIYGDPYPEYCTVETDEIIINVHFLDVAEDGSLQGWVAVYAGHHSTQLGNSSETIEIGRDIDLGEYADEIVNFLRKAKKRPVNVHKIEEILQKAMNPYY